MSISAQIALALATALTAAFGLTMRWPNGRRLAVVLLLAPIMFGLPFLFIPREQRLWRALTAIYCATWWIRVYDVHYGIVRTGRPLTWRDYLAFLVNVCSLVQRRLKDEPVPHMASEWRRLLWAGFAFGLAGLIWATTGSSIDGDVHFAVEHCVKAVIIGLWIYSGFAAVTALWRLAGLRGRVLACNFFAAKTPADFWRRYNRHTGQFLHDDAFVPLRRRLGSFGATMAVFALNGIGHEYIALAAIGRVQGYQVAFFLIQGLAVAATQRWKPSGALAVAGVVATFLFNVATSLLFFASGNQFIQWYSTAAPEWVQPH